MMTKSETRRLSSIENQIKTFAVFTECQRGFRVKSLQEVFLRFMHSMIGLNGLLNPRHNIGVTNGWSLHPQMLAKMETDSLFPTRRQRIYTESTYDQIQDSGIEPPSTVPSFVGLDKGIVESPVESEDLAGQLVFAKVSCYSVRRSARVIVAGEGNAPAVDCMLRDSSRRR